MFILKGEEIAGGWRNLHNKEICGVTLSHILINQLKEHKINGLCSMQVKYYK
jgi:hypothetical protein